MPTGDLDYGQRDPRMEETINAARAREELPEKGLTLEYRMDQLDKAHMELSLSIDAIRERFDTVLRPAETTVSGDVMTTLRDPDMSEKAHRIYTMMLRVHDMNAALHDIINRCDV